MPRIMPNEADDSTNDFVDAQIRTRPDALRGMMRTTEEALHTEPEELRPDEAVEFHDESNLIAPLPRAGKSQRWVRVVLPDGTPDVRNWMRALRDGYTPRDPRTIRINNHYMPHRNFEGHEVFQSGSMVLMEIDDARRAVLREKVDANRDRLNQGMTHDHESVSAEGIRRGMSPIHRDEQVSSSKRPPTMAD